MLLVGCLFKRKLCVWIAMLKTESFNISKIDTLPGYVTDPYESKLNSCFKTLFFKVKQTVKLICYAFFGWCMFLGSEKPRFCYHGFDLKGDLVELNALVKNSGDKKRVGSSTNRITYKPKRTFFWAAILFFNFFFFNGVGEPFSLVVVTESQSIGIPRTEEGDEQN